MMTLSLDQQEKDILQQTLQASLNRLRDEISHTDSSEYRDLLKSRKEVLIKIQERLH